MAYNIVVQVSTQGAEKIDQTTESLNDATQAAAKTTQALKGVGEAAADGMTSASTAARQAAEAVKDMADGAERSAAYLEAYKKAIDDQYAAINAKKFDDENLRRINAPMEEYIAQISSLNRLLDAGKISMERYDAELAHAEQELASLRPEPVNEALRRQAELLDQITGPIRRYEQDLAALQALLAGGAINLEQYDAQLAKAQKRAEAGGAIAPVQGPKQQTAAGGGGGEEEPQLGEQAVNRVAGTLSGLIGGGAILALGQQIEGLVTRWHDVEDVAIRATNAAQRFADENRSVTVVIDQQLALAERLHATYSQTVALYGRLAESADALKLSEGELTQLTAEFGEAVQIGGKSIDAADGIMRRFAYGLAAGKIETREMRSIMREVPVIADLWTKSFGATRDQLLQMVKDGRVSTEDLMRALLNGGQAIDQQFSKLQRTHAQTVDEWIETEKILSQRYDVSFGSGHGAQATVDLLKQNQDQLKLALGSGGQLGDLAKAAEQQLHDENRAAIASTIDDLKNLTGAFRPIGDAYRAWVGDTAAVRAEVTKLNEPVQAAKSELVTLNKAFSTGQIDVDTYNKRLNELQTTINHGVGSQAFAILEPIRKARLELDMLNNEIENGANITQAEYRKAFEQYQTAIHGGVTPEDLKLNNPVLNAKDALADLIEKQKEGKITAEAYRKEYDSLVTTINDGRLPEAIKIWEEINLPIQQAARDLAAANALLRAGRVDVEEYTAELKKISDTHKSGDALLLADGVARLDQQMDRGLLTMRQYDEAIKKLVIDFGTLRTTASGIQYRIAPQGPEGPAGLLPHTMPAPYLPSATDNADVRGVLAQVQSTTLVPGLSDELKAMNEQLARANALADEFVAPSVKYEQRIKDINAALQINHITEEQATAARRHARDTLNQENEALAAVKGPMEQYQAALQKLNDQLEAHDISQKQYADGVDKARIAMLEATGAAQTFQGALEIDWLKAKQGADSFGASTAKLFESDVGKFNDNVITALTGGGPEAQQARQALAQLQDQYQKGAVTAADYATKYKQLSDQLAASTDIWKNISTAFDSFVDSMVADLERLLIKWLEMQAIQGIVGLFSSTGGGGDTAAGASTFANVDDVIRGLGYGFANGGSYVVGGSGGTDSQLQAFWATPGERVTITPPGAYSSGPSLAAIVAAVRQQPAAPAVHIHNHYDSAVSQAALDGPGGQRSVINTLRVNQAAVRNLTSRPRRA